MCSMESPAVQPQASPQRSRERSRRNAGPRFEKQYLNKVDVSGYPSYTQPQDLTQLFSNYGPVTVEKLCNKFATLNFNRVGDAKAALKDSMRIMMYGNFLTLKSHEKKKDRSNKRFFPKSKEKETGVQPQQLALTGPFLEQLDGLLAAVRLTQDQAVAVSRLYADVEFALQEIWPGCCAVPFGSITTGLGVKTSDADCYLTTPNQPNTENHVNKAKRVLNKYPQIFTEIVAIPNANTPIVKFFHTPTETNCDLSFKTPLGVQNSKLIAFLLYSDPRLIPMAVLIKYWAKVCGFSGSGKLTNYALTMLIIFFLQQTPMSILPSVQWLQNDPNDEYIVDHWNTGFMDRMDEMPTCDNTSTISELLGSFFKYYSTFDFNQNIVCPLLGYPIKKDDFKNFEELPDEFDRYKNNVRNNYVQRLRFTTSIVVQDPFELCHNVASPVGSRLALEIKEYFKFAAKAYDDEKNNNCEGFLKKILLDKPVMPNVRKTNPSFRAILHPSVIRDVTDPDWKSVIREVVFIIFETILKLKLTKVELEPNQSSKRDKEKYSTTLTKSVWKRKQFSRLYNWTELNFLERQIRITEEIINVDRNNINLKFDVIFDFTRDTKNSVVTIKSEDGDICLFKEFGSFYLSVFHRWFSTLLKPYLGTPTQRNDSNEVKNDNIIGVQTENESSSEEEQEKSNDDPDKGNSDDVKENESSGEEEQEKSNDDPDKGSSDGVKENESSGEEEQEKSNDDPDKGSSDDVKE